MGDSILSQAEIDALLNGDSEVKDERQPVLAAKVTFVRTIRIPNDGLCANVCRRWKSLMSALARHFRMGLFNLLRRSPDITVGAIRIQPYMNLPATCRCRPT
ncbi:flagellar motor switch protein FliM [Escherichia coli]|uniref:Flagellar motor switch protein FliM n=1 Tax=Escherichia coli TaxID=562 RepID=A0A485JD17_ECOLX|nr:flagellar motor switch protein FliM [Escherichia coli]